MVNTEKNYLGIDWGSSKIGVALAHAETRLALAYGAFKNDETFLDELAELIMKEEIGTIVIGIPTHDKRVGEYGGEKLGKEIADRFGIQVEYQDEMFTSKMAQANLIGQGEKHVSSHDDAEAASILLQSWLDHVVPEHV